MQVTNSKRTGLTPIPENLRAYLTVEQEKALPQLEMKGISLFAVRRPLFQEPIVIVKFQTRSGYGVLLKNGDVDYFPDIVVRGEVRSETSKLMQNFAGKNTHDRSIG